MAAAAIAAGAAGAAASGIAGLYAAYQDKKAQQRAESGAANAANAIAQGWNNSSSAYDDANNYINSYYNSMTGDGGLYNSGALSQAQQNYQNLLNGSGTTYNAGTFNYDGDVNDFYDKAWALNSDAQNRALENSAANAGHLYSSGLASNIAGQTSANATSAYKNALE